MYDIDLVIAEGRTTDADTAADMIDGAASWQPLLSSSTGITYDVATRYRPARRHPPSDVITADEAATASATARPSSAQNTGHSDRQMLQKTINLQQT